MIEFIKFLGRIKPLRHRDLDASSTLVRRHLDDRLQNGEVVLFPDNSLKVSS